MNGHPGWYFSLVFVVGLLLNQACHDKAPETPTEQQISFQKVDGYRGIWFELGQKLPYGDKYSGGLGTYTAKHMPIAIYSEEVDKTFFVYGGTTNAEERHLLCMIGSYDHQNHLVSEPTIVMDKDTVNDPHDNPSLLIDSSGFLWVFISGRSTHRPGYKFKSTAPYSIDTFVLISQEEMTYPQPWFDPGKGYFHFFTKYSGIRELYYQTSKNGTDWSPHYKLAGIVEEGLSKAGHYQVTGLGRSKVGTFFNRHRDGHPDARTDLYYIESLDFGDHWQTVEGQEVSLPITKVSDATRVHDYHGQDKFVYMKDMTYDDQDRPHCLYITSKGHEPGPDNRPYTWWYTRWDGQEWLTDSICNSDHNYDMGSFYLTDSSLYVIGPTSTGPQKWAGGGEIAIWESDLSGSQWRLKTRVTDQSTYNHSYIRRPLNARNPFLYFWADGHGHDFSTSRLYFGDLAGNIWQLPYEMNEDNIEPAKYP